MVGAYGTTSEVSWLFLLSDWVLALVIVAAAYSLWTRRRLKLFLAAGGTRPATDSPADDLPDHILRRGPHPAPLFEGDELLLEVGLDNAGAARGPAWIAGNVAGRALDAGTGLVPRTGWRSEVVLAGLRRGPVGATGWSIVTSDPLGMWRGRRRCADKEVALVLPRFMSLTGRVEVRELESSVPSPRAGAGSEMFGIREYRPGDSLRRIHWRSTARHGELVVREYQPPGLQVLGIMVDPAPPSAEIADGIARIAASEAWDCLREGGQVVIWGPRLEPSDSPRDLWGLLEWLARYPNLPAGESEERADVIVTADPTLLDGGAIRSWLVGDAEVDADVAFQRVGTQWPL
jgi:uncharacterized protein (DUF58 family)